MTALPVRLAELVALCRRELAGRGVADRAEGEILAAHLAGVPRSRLLLEAHREVGDPGAAVRAMAARRGGGEPLQYVLGAWEFYGREFRLTRDTLIPRPETEQLVEAVIAAWRLRGAAGRFLDVGTGSGAIAVTLAAEMPGTRGVAVDLSAGALAVARENARRAGVADRLLFVRGDLFSALKTGGAFDVVVSNPPYIPEAEWKALPPEVRDFEPPEALRAGPDGLSVIRRLVASAGAHLKAGGELWCEIGEAQGEAVRRLPAGPLRFAGLFRDLAGKDRIARWVLSAPESGD